MTLERLSVVSLAIVAGCSSSPSSPAGVRGEDASVEDTARPGVVVPPVDAGSHAVDGVTDARPSVPPVPVEACPVRGTSTFAYRPSWPGVTSVTVMGGFGQPNDWSPTDPFLTLTKGSDGTYTGSTTLPVGTYAYLYRVVGDADTPNPTTWYRYAVDPINADLVVCPSGSPIYEGGGGLPVPCSSLTMPLGAAPELFHLHGTVNLAGQPFSGLWAELHRNETTFHHFFVNRTDTAADGSLDLCVAAGSYEVRVDNMAAEYNPNGAQPNPLTVQQVRYGAIDKTVSADTTIQTVDFAYPYYAPMRPTPTASLPTNFTYALLGGAVEGRVGVFDPAVGSGLGDAYFESQFSAATSATFDGTFYTGAMVTTGKQYWWGTDQHFAMDADGSQWLVQSMVFPLTFQ